MDLKTMLVLINDARMSARMDHLERQTRLAAPMDCTDKAAWLREYRLEREILARLDRMPQIDTTPRCAMNCGLAPGQLPDCDECDRGPRIVR